MKRFANVLKLQDVEILIAVIISDLIAAYFIKSKQEETIFKIIMGQNNDLIIPKIRIGAVCKAIFHSSVVSQGFHASVKLH